MARAFGTTDTPVTYALRNGKARPTATPKISVAGADWKCHLLWEELCRYTGKGRGPGRNENVRT